MKAPIPNYTDYLVFEDGRVFSKKTNRFLKFNQSRTGYLSVELFNESGSKRLLVHRLVAQAFIPNPNNYPQVNHIDENKQNNNVSNLEWCTAQYNMNYGKAPAARHSKIDYSAPCFRKRAIKNAMAMRKPVDQFSLSGKLIASYASGKDASRATGLNHSHILECCHGKRYKTVGGYIWKFRKVG